MKKYIKLVVFSLLIIALGNSCDEYLMNDESSTITEENLFVNIDFAEKAVLGIYNAYSNNYTYLYNYAAGVYCETDILWSSDQNNFSYPAHYTNMESNKYIGTQWTNLYKSIEAANIVIDGLPESDLWNGEDSEKARHLYGEAVTLRAFAYWQLIFIFGDVPFYTESTKGDSDFYPPKTDRDLICEFLIQDLKDIEDYVQWMDLAGGTFERVSKGFVKGLRARMALQYAGYSLRNKTFETRRGRYWQEYLQIANQESWELMQSGKHLLNPSFEQIFRDMHTTTFDRTYKEWLFCLPSGKDIGVGTWGTQQIGMWIKGGVKYGSYEAKSRWKSSPVYFYSFNSEDLRREVACAPYNRYDSDPSQHQVILPNHSTTWAATKWRKSWVQPQLAGQNSVWLGIDIPVMRYADVVLMFAESENEINGPTAKAKEALASVRRRAFPEEFWPENVDHYVDSVSASKESFFNAIVDERAWEFGGEFIRKPDLVRWNLYGTKIREWKENMMHLINDDDPKYAHVPQYVYWRYPNDGEEIEILNLDYRLPDAAIEGYERSGWISTMSDGWKTNWETKYLPAVAEGYDESKNNHLYPLPLDILATGRGAWENDQIP